MAEQELPIRRIEATQANGSHEMRSWYASLTREDRNTFWACYGGWTLNVLDGQL
jgi:hypothetical protein